MLAPWISTAGRAALGLALGLAITFTGGHTATFGLVAFGVFAVLSGVLLLTSTFGPRAATEGRTAFRAQGVVSVVAGIAALAVPSGGIGYLVWVLSGWAIVTGALELVSGIRARGRVTASRDWVIVGALTVLLGVVALVIPPDIADYFAGDKGVEGLLTSPIIIIGMLGAWAVITGVLQAIAAASPKQTAPTPRVKAVA
ncbi:MAG: DUF308 domain-containing protein [Pseudolysinimonas sp.]